MFHPILLTVDLAEQTHSSVHILRQRLDTLRLWRLFQATLPAVPRNCWRRASATGHLDVAAARIDEDVVCVTADVEHLLLSAPATHERYRLCSLSPVCELDCSWVGYRFCMRDMNALKSLDSDAYAVQVERVLNELLVARA